MDLDALLRARLAPLDPTRLELRDDGDLHRGHAGAAGGAGHFSLLIVSERFTGQSRLARHRAVMERVGDLIPHPLHALAVRRTHPKIPSRPKGNHA
jgi:BolA protein